MTDVKNSSALALYEIPAPTAKPTANLRQCGFLITFPDWDPTLITKCLPNVRNCRHFEESCVDLSLISRRLEPASHRILSGNPSP